MHGSDKPRSAPVDSTPPPATGLFRSFWMGGYEGADHINGNGVVQDMAHASGHSLHLEDDHRRAAELGILTVRESIGWRLAESAAGVHDLKPVRRIALSAKRHGLQVLWTFMHYGTPPDVTLLDDTFIPRFVDFAVAMAKVIGPLSEQPPVYNLINEIGFLAWAVSATNLMHPYRSDPANGGEATLISGYDVKLRLVRATLAASAAIRRIDPRARFLQVEPLVHVVAPLDRPELASLAAEIGTYQWQTWDLLGGIDDSALGTFAPALDLIGVNYYHAGQWEAVSDERLAWLPRDPRRLPFRSMLQAAWQRYSRPMMVAETSHYGAGRALWLNEIAAEVEATRNAGVPVEGLCLYPLVDRPDWNDPAHWHHSGLWDVDPAAADEPAPATVDPDPVPPRRRVLCTSYAAALLEWQRCLPNRQTEGTTTMKCLIVFSHLRWSFVYQRPQHLMSRLARHHRVLFVEEPLHTDGPARLECTSHGPNIEVLVPHTAVAAGGFHDDQLPLLEPMLASFLEEQGIDQTLVWFYTPMALPLLAILEPEAVIYDCMDQLSAFRNAPRQLRQRETALLRLADLVLTGGPALYEAKRGSNPNVHCLPSSVDAAHYAPQNLDPAASHAADARLLQCDIPAPRLGFFGVIDERFDIELLREMAEAHPEWQLVMVGPVVKIDPAELPRAPNIHWLGMQPYDLLPHLMGAWDVCLMPFALNESTRFISPTKTLEYLAGEKPVVSTPVGDVIALYGSAVRIASAGEAFISACEQALAEGAASRAERSARMKTLVGASSWDRSAATVHELIDALLRRQPSGAVPALFPAGPAAPSDKRIAATSVLPVRSAAGG